MPKIDGLTLGKTISTNQMPPLIIFITSHKEMMTWGYHVRAFRFLCKPLEDSTFQEAILSAIKEILLVDTIMLSHAGNKHLINVKDIIYIESLGEGCCIYTTSSKYIQKEPLKHWLNRLPPHNFIQTHRAFIINLGHVQMIKPTLVHMKNGSEILISVRKRKHLQDALHEYIRRKSRR